MKITAYFNYNAKAKTKQGQKRITPKRNNNSPNLHLKRNTHSTFNKST